LALPRFGLPGVRLRGQGLGAILARFDLHCSSRRSGSLLEPCDQNHTSHESDKHRKTK
jgi:hypothetical protein